MTDPARPRSVFFGTPDFAVPILEATAACTEVVAVVTQPDRPRGRGQELAPPPTKVWALARGLPVFQPTKLRDGVLAAELRGDELHGAEVFTGTGIQLPRALGRDAEHHMERTLQQLRGGSAQHGGGIALDTGHPQAWRPGEQYGLQEVGVHLMGLKHTSLS